ncbi:hypothetical protein MMA231_01481 [Asticcacaulis sp. MM231]|uniref:hypothetical protein n=1 Tax=Asticcacaulis sp. MM231 TaxID=3157666 RepID=UPI0032D583CF
MYVRFVTPLIHPDSGMETGFFRASWYLYRTGCPDWIYEELDIQFRWFNRNLPVPDRVARHFKRRNSIYGVCWFHTAARECIDRARYCAWLITEGGVPVQAVKLRSPREIIWHDDHQVVLRPHHDMPRAFPDTRFALRGRHV